MAGQHPYGAFSVTPSYRIRVDGIFSDDISISTAGVVAICRKIINNAHLGRYSAQRNFFLFSNFRQHSGSRQLSAPRLLTLEELTKSLKSTLNTLSLILIYLSISLPSYLAAAVQTECWEPGCECRKLECQV